MNVWDQILARIETKVNRYSFYTWFRPTSFVADDRNSITVSVPNDVFKDWLTRHYSRVIAEALAEVQRPNLTVNFVADPQAEGATMPLDPEQMPVADDQPPVPPTPGSAAGLNPRYTFDTFIVGSSNQFAHAACRAVAEAPSRSYNPLFIYGGVGLGKTHLLVAIGHQMFGLSPRLRVKYVTSESFMAEFIKAVRERQGYQFAARYRDIDVLLVDDIQFLAKREETQTEFFHTFNALHQKDRQIVIASDRPPQELGMEERLQSRFRLGLCVDVQPPDLETRIAILQLKAQRDELHVPDDVIEFIANTFDQNIRELEGALVRVVAWGDLTGQPITSELAEQALEDLLPQAEAEIPPDLILEESARYFGLSVQDLISPNRSRPLTTARHVAMYLMRECSGQSLVKIGETFGGRDHTTARHGILKVEKDMRARTATYRQVQDLSRIIRGRARAG